MNEKARQTHENVALRHVLAADAWPLEKCAAAVAHKEPFSFRARNVARSLHHLSKQFLLFSL
jgi:hypothetical protein